MQFVETAVPNVLALDQAFNITIGGVQEPWKIKISKNFLSGKSSFVMDYMNYLIWQPSGSPTPTKNTGCSGLSYTLIKKSWPESWKQDAILSRPESKAAYYGATGTVHNLLAEEIKMIGMHTATLEVKSDLDILSASKTITFEIEVMDCKVIDFRPGPQVIQTVEVQKGQKAVFPFSEFQMTPACPFNVDYTITLVKKPYGQNYPELFPSSDEGWQPNPPLVSLDGESITIEPTSASH